ncbi:MAG: aldo/keto reductase [Ignavibacteriales bacterium]|nr:aldo/keto reductase [Ignavibacteriales bacterium]
MNKRQLGKNGPELTNIGFGTWAIGGPWQFGWGKVDDNVSIKAIHAALDNGINWIDTAAVYGFGHSEKVVGGALKGIRENVFLATKCGLVNDGFGNAINNLDPKSIRNEIEESLKRLQTDYIDLYQIHKPDPKVPVEDSWGTLVELKKEGKTKFIGVSTYDNSLLEKCIKIEQVQSLQPPYSMLKRDYEESIFSYCLKKNIGVVAYSPMQAGLLSGKFDINKLAEDDWRRKNFFFKEPYLSKALSLVKKLQPIAKKTGKTVGQLAVAWVLKNPAITSAIVGDRTAEQCRENIKAADYILSEDEMEEINKYLEEFQ